MLLDGETLALTQAIEPVLRQAGDDGVLKAELMQSQVEISTRPCRTAEEALDELRGLRRSRPAARPGRLRSAPTIIGIAGRLREWSD